MYFLHIKTNFIDDYFLIRVKNKELENFHKEYVKYLNFFIDDLYYIFKLKLK